MARSEHNTIQTNPRDKGLAEAIYSAYKWQKYEVMDDCDRKLRCGKSKKSGNKHGWYADANGQVLCQGAWTVYENTIKRSNRHMYLSCEHMSCRLLVKVSAVCLGMSWVLISWQKVSAYKRKLEYTVYLRVFMSIPQRGRVVIHG